MRLVKLLADLTEAIVDRWTASVKDHAQHVETLRQFTVPVRHPYRAG